MLPILWLSSFAPMTRRSSTGLKGLATFSTSTSIFRGMVLNPVAVVRALQSRNVSQGSLGKGRPDPPDLVRCALLSDTPVTCWLWLAIKMDRRGAGRFALWRQCLCVHTWQYHIPPLQFPLHVANEIADGCEASCWPTIRVSVICGGVARYFRRLLTLRVRRDSRRM